MKKRVLIKRAALSAATIFLLGTLAGCAGGDGSGAASTSSQTTDGLKGSYVFSVVGSDPTDGDYAVIGSFVGDGQGHITSSVADYNLGSGIDAGVPLTGSYIQSGSSVVVTLTDGKSVNDSLTISLASSGTSQIQSFDGTGSGTLYPQTTSGFTTPGTYSVAIQGEAQGTLTGSGQFVVGAGGTFLGGTLSEMNGATLTQTAGISGFLAAPNAAGRGQASVAGNNMSYYVISPNQIRMIGLDERALLLLPAQKQ